MPLDLRHHPTRPAPALRLVAEARVEAAHVVRGATHRPREERRDLRLKYLVGGQANRVLETLRFQVLVCGSLVWIASPLRLMLSAVARSPGRPTSGVSPQFVVP